MAINDECLEAFEEIKEILDVFYSGNDIKMINPCFKQFAGEILVLSKITKDIIIKLKYN